MPKLSDSLNLLSGPGQTRALMRVHDWSGSVLGNPSNWQPELRFLLRMVLDNSFPAFIAWGKELGFLYNDGYARILGDKHPAALGARFQDIWSEIWTDILPIIEDALSGKSSYFEDLPLTIVRTGHPEEAWFTFSYSPVYLANGTIGGMHCTVMETTDKVLATRRQTFQLELAEALRPLASPEAIVEEATRQLGEFMHTDRTWYSEIDDEARRFTNRYVWQACDLPAIPAAGRIDAYGPTLLDTLRRGTPLVVSDVSRDPILGAHAAQYRSLAIGSILIVPLIQDGRLATILNLSMVGSHHWSAHEIELAICVGEYTWAMNMRARAERAERAAEARYAAELAESDRRKNEFLATLAHELRNPLAPLRTGLEVMRLATSRPETVAQVREMMGRQINHMVRLIDDLLDIARISNGKVVLQKTPTDLAGVVAHAVETSLPLIEANRHQLTVSVPEHPIVVDIDPVRIEQAVGNLLTNAAKYTPEGGKIALSVTHEGQHWLIRVRDNGIGIAPNALPLVFDMFAQVGKGMDRSRGGLGIGLAIVNRLVELHGGSVSAESEGNDMGSTFTLRLPASAPAGVDAAAVTDGKGQANADRPLDILVADDNADAAEMLAHLLEFEGHHVLIANHGSEAVRIARERRPQVAIVDIGMPGMSGYEVAQAMRNMPEMRQATLVALTGWGTPEDIHRSLDAGFDFHLTKPVELGALTQVLRPPPHHSKPGMPP